MDSEKFATDCVLQERRLLKFWFAEDTDYFDQMTNAYDFFKELVKPDSFPKGLFTSSLSFELI